MNIPWLAPLQGQLVVSCQALEDEPLFGAEIMAKMALAALKGGATAIRANTPPDIRAIRQAVRLPIFGLYKDWLPGYDVYITPSLNHARQVAQAGADAICFDATARPHPDRLPLKEIVRRMHLETGLPLMADISTLDEGRRAEDCGAEMISTALAGVTPYSRKQTRPDLELVSELAIHLTIPVFAEGRYYTPEQAIEALSAGAFAVVVGGAITRPHETTARFVAALQQRQQAG